VIDEANRAVRELVRVVMGMPENSVRPADQSIPAGGQTQEFATVRIMTTGDVGTPVQRLLDDGNGGTTEAVEVPKQFTASVQFFRSPAKDAAGIARASNAAFDRAARLAQRLWLASSAELLRTMNLGFLGSSEPRNLSALAGSTWESRGSVDLIFDFIARETAPIETVAGVPFTLLVQEPDGVVQTRSIEVTP